MPPLKPTVPGSDRAKKFEEFSTAERIDWIVQTRKEAQGVFGVAAPVGLVDVVNLKRCLAFFDELPAAAKADGELQGTVDDLRELLARVPERPPVKARA
jgi:hypothetical protein